MDYGNQDDGGIEGLIKDFKDLLKDNSNRAGLAAMAGSLALSRYVITAKLDEAIMASGYSTELAQQGELMGILGAAAIGAAAFGVGKYAYKAFESASQR